MLYAVRSGAEARRRRGEFRREGVRRWTTARIVEAGVERCRRHPRLHPRPREVREARARGRGDGAKPARKPVRPAPIRRGRCSSRTEGERVGFAIFFHNYSTFLGRPGLYLEDLYVRPERRGHGYGKLLFRHLAGLAVARGCGRLEWWVLDWNRGAIDFYRSLGAEPMSDWTVYRLSGDSAAAPGVADGVRLNGRSAQRRFFAPPRSC